MSLQQPIQISLPPGPITLTIPTILKQAFTITNLTLRPVIIYPILSHEDEIFLSTSNRIKILQAFEEVQLSLGLKSMTFGVREIIKPKLRIYFWQIKEFRDEDELLLQQDEQLLKSPRKIINSQTKNNHFSYQPKQNHLSKQQQNLQNINKQRKYSYQSNEQKHQKQMSSQQFENYMKRNRVKKEILLKYRQKMFSIKNTSEQMYDKMRLKQQNKSNIKEFVSTKNWDKNQKSIKLNNGVQNNNHFESDTQSDQQSFSRLMCRDYDIEIKISDTLRVLYPLNSELNINVNNQKQIYLLQNVIKPGIIELTQSERRQQLQFIQNRLFRQCQQLGKVKAIDRLNEDIVSRKQLNQNQNKQCQQIIQNKSIRKISASSNQIKVSNNFNNSNNRSLSIKIPQKRILLQRYAIQYKQKITKPLLNKQNKQDQQDEQSLKFKQGNEILSCYFIEIITKKYFYLFKLIKILRYDYYYGGFRQQNINKNIKEQNIKRKMSELINDNVKCNNKIKRNLLKLPMLIDLQKINIQKKKQLFYSNRQAILINQTQIKKNNIDLQDNIINKKQITEHNKINKKQIKINKNQIQIKQKQKQKQKSQIIYNKQIYKQTKYYKQTKQYKQNKEIQIKQQLNNIQIDRLNQNNLSIQSHDIKPYQRQVKYNLIKQQIIDKQIKQQINDNLIKQQIKNNLIKQQIKQQQIFNKQNNQSKLKNIQTNQQKQQQQIQQSTNYNINQQNQQHYIKQQHQQQFPPSKQLVNQINKNQNINQINYNKQTSLIQFINLPQNIKHEQPLIIKPQVSIFQVEKYNRKAKSFTQSKSYNSDQEEKYHTSMLQFNRQGHHFQLQYQNPQALYQLSQQFDTVQQSQSIEKHINTIHNQQQLQQQLQEQNDIVKELTNTILQKKKSSQSDNDQHKKKKPKFLFTNNDIPIQQPDKSPRKRNALSQSFSHSFQSHLSNHQSLTKPQYIQEFIVYPDPILAIHIFNLTSSEQLSQHKLSSLSLNGPVAFLLFRTHLLYFPISNPQLKKTINIDPLKLQDTINYKTFITAYKQEQIILANGCYLYWIDLTNKSSQWKYVQRKQIYCIEVIQQMGLLAVGGKNFSKLSLFGKQTFRSNIKIYNCGKSQRSHLFTYDIPINEPVGNVHYMKYITTPPSGGKLLITYTNYNDQIYRLIFFRIRGYNTIQMYGKIQLNEVGIQSIMGMKYNSRSQKLVILEQVDENHSALKKLKVKSMYQKAQVLTECIKMELGNYESFQIGGDKQAQWYSLITKGKSTASIYRSYKFHNNPQIIKLQNHDIDAVFDINQGNEVLIKGYDFVKIKKKKKTVQQTYK